MINDAELSPHDALTLPSHLHSHSSLPLSPVSQPIPHQSLGDVPAGGQRFEMPAAVDQLNLLQVHRLQDLLAGPVHHLQLLVAVHQHQGTTVDPLH